jgi:hypothetical protein
MKRHGVPEGRKTFRSQTTGALYALELERGLKSYRLPERGGVVV